MTLETRRSPDGHTRTPSDEDAAYCEIRNLAHILQYLGAVRRDHRGSLRPLGIYAVLPSRKALFMGYRSHGSPWIHRLVVLPRPEVRLTFAFTRGRSRWYVRPSGATLRESAAANRRTRP